MSPLSYTVIPDWYSKSKPLIMSIMNTPLQLPYKIQSYLFFLSWSVLNTHFQSYLLLPAYKHYAINLIPYIPIYHYSNILLLFLPHITYTKSKYEPLNRRELKNLHLSFILYPQAPVHSINHQEVMKPVVGRKDYVVPSPWGLAF